MILEKIHIKNSIHKIQLVIIFFFAISIFTPSCIEEPKVSKREFRSMVDTLYNREIASFNAELDSLCDLQTEIIIQHNVDSLMKVRLEQIEKLIQDQ